MDSVNEPWWSEGLRFHCTQCGQCCTGQPGFVFLSPIDITRLAQHFQLSEEEFLKKYARFVDGGYSLNEHPENYDCVLLKDQKCSAYEARPVQCRTFPWWISQIETPSAWKKAKSFCEGIDHPDAPVVSPDIIREQSLLYLDHLLERHFYSEV